MGALPASAPPGRSRNESNTAVTRTSRGRSHRLNPTGTRLSPSSGVCVRYLRRSPLSAGTTAPFFWMTLGHLPKLGPEIVGVRQKAFGSSIRPDQIGCSELRRRPLRHTVDSTLKHWSFRRSLSRLDGDGGERREAQRRRHTVSGPATRTGVLLPCPDGTKPTPTSLASEHFSPPDVPEYPPWSFIQTGRRANPPIATFQTSGFSR
jgi:hypothetical protein